MSRHMMRGRVRPVFCAEPLKPRQLLSRPTVVSAAFEYETSPHVYVVQFDQDVSASLAAADLRVEAVTSTDQDPLATSLAYDAVTNTASFSFAGVLPDANYRAVLSSEDVTNAAGETLAGDHVRDLFFLLADITGPGGTPDTQVNLADFNRLSGNMGKSPATYSDGDLNYDGLVNLADFNILSARFGATMPAPPAGPGQTTVRTVTSSSVETNWIDSVSGELGWRVQWSFDGQNFDHYTNLGADTEVFLHSGLPDGTRIWYRTRAYGNGLDTAYTPKVATTTVLPAPGQPVVTELDSGRFEIRWDDNSQNETGFVVTVSNGTGQSREFTVDASAGTEASLFLDDMAPAGGYTVSVRATGLVDSASSLPTTHTVRITAPSHLMAVAMSSSEVRLDWKDRSRNEAYFRIERSFIGPTSGWTQIGLVTLNVTTWSNYGLPANQPVWYRVFANGSLGNSGYSNVVGVTTFPSGFVPEGDEGGEEEPPPQSQSGGWTLYGDDVSVSGGNTITLGVSDLEETDLQGKQIRAASYPLGANPPDLISFDYDLWSWDGPMGIWDVFSVTVTDAPYPDAGLNHPLSGTSNWSWTGGAYGDWVLDHGSGTATVAVPQTAGDKWLNVVLDTYPRRATYPDGFGDENYPSWGTISIRAVDVAVDANNDGTLDAADAAVEDAGPGKLVVANNDDDNENGTPDYLESGTVVNEDNLVEMRLSVFPPDMSGTVSLNIVSGSEKVRLYEASDRSVPLSQTEWQVGQHPTSVWLEAIAGSFADGDIEIEATTTPSTAPTQPATDRVRFTAAHVKEIAGTLGGITKAGAGREDKVAWPAQPAAVPVLRGSGTFELAGVVPADPAPFVKENLRWQVVRNTNDSAALQQEDPPTVTPNANDPLKATLTTDSVGSFSIVLYDDIDHVAGYSQNDPVLKVYRLVQVQIDLENSTVATFNDIQIDAGQVGGQATTTFKFERPNNLADLELDAKVTLRGGGPTEVLGLNHIKLGWLGNALSTSIVADYENGHKVRERIDPDAVVDFPLLDTQRESPGTGGVTAFRFSSRETLTDEQPGAGQARSILVEDAPSVRVPDIYPTINDNSHVTAVNGALEFKEYLVGFSEAFNRTYVAVGTVGWKSELHAQFVNNQWNTQGSMVSSPQNVAEAVAPMRRVEEIGGRTVGPTFLDVLDFEYIPGGP